MTTSEQIQKQNEAACVSVALHERPVCDYCGKEDEGTHWELSGEFECDACYDARVKATL
jgi:hypothetical protein